ncbi:symplekin [Capsicum chacoense]
MAGPIREQALPLLAAANNNGDLAVKLSSLKQLKDILLSAEPSQVAELIRYLIDLQSSPESLVRKCLIEVIEAIGMKAKEHLLVLMPVVFACLKDMNSIVAKQSIISGMKIFCGVLEELSSQFHRHGIVERWLEELWTWMIKFKDTVFGFIFEAGPIGTKLLALKFLETYILLFTSSDGEKSGAQAKRGWTFNISWVVGHHPVLDPASLTSDAKNNVGILLDLLRSASSLHGLLTISVINSLAVVARRRPIHYNRIFSALLDFDPNFEMTKGGHAASVQYSVRTAFLGFLRCTHPAILESRERLLKSLRAMNAGDAADQVLRQLDKMMRNNERASRDSRLNKDELLSNNFPISADPTKKRSTPLDNEDPSNNYDLTTKRVHYGPNNHNHTAPLVERNDSGKECVDEEDPVVAQMIDMIGALLAEGERGANSLELLINRIPPDLLADVVISNMKNLPKSCPPLERFGSLSLAQASDSTNPSQIMAPMDSSLGQHAWVPGSQTPISLSIATSSSLPEMPTSASLPFDSKRDPRRDPRRLDPRRTAVSVEVSPPLVAEHNTSAMQSPTPQSEINPPSSSNIDIAVPLVSSFECMLTAYPKMETDSVTAESPPGPGASLLAPKEEVHDEDWNEAIPARESDAATHVPLSSPGNAEQEVMPDIPSEVGMTNEIYSPLLETDQLSPPISTAATPEDVCEELPAVPPFIDLTHEQQRNMGTLAVEQIIDSYKKLKETDSKHTGMALLSRLVAQIGADAEADAHVVVMIQRHIFSDNQHEKVHELAMHVLYHLHYLMLSDTVENISPAAALYEKFLLSAAKSLLDSLPANDKSFSRLLNEVPYLPESVMRLLLDLCSENYLGRDGRDGDRVTQGLGAVWSLILGRPPNRQACLDIALKCAIHPQDDVRAKAIRLVANKLYVVGDISDNIEQFAKNMFLSALDQHVTDAEYSQSGTSVQRTGETGNQEASVSGSQMSEPGFAENDYVKSAASDSQSDSELSLAQAQRLISLFFALCTKKYSLLHLVFDTYARAPKAIKQAVHRHMPVLIRAIGSSCSELLHIISDPPQGCENLLTQVLHILSEGATPPPDLVEVVKRLYETKLKDATVLIPVLSSYSKSEVLPIFPRLVALPLDKFQIALARILQGSAHTGPALTPAEVLVAIHDINPERDGLPLKKITDACSACFEQRTVFTQQVLAKALRQMVDQTPLPLLFMRTVIQAIDAFPTLVDLVMEILSKLVIRQVWRMPKLWVGFLKCVSQTQPHSFPVLLQLPPPQLESALNKYANLRSPLVAFANQPNIKTSLPRSTLAQLGLFNEPSLQQPHLSSNVRASETGASVNGTTLT